MLPKKMKVVLPPEIIDEIADYVSDYISDETGFCHYGFDLDVRVTAKNIEYDTEDT